MGLYLVDKLSKREVITSLSNILDVDYLFMRIKRFSMPPFLKPTPVYEVRICYNLCFGLYRLKITEWDWHYLFKLLTIRLNFASLDYQGGSYRAVV